MINLNESDVITFYNNTFSLRKTSSFFGVSVSPIKRILDKNNVVKNSSRKYQCDFRFFEKIDTEEKAYWLGFLYADGYVRIRKYGSEIKLKIKDKEHLRKFNKSLKSNYPVTRVKNSNCWQVCISSSKMVKDLIDKGCIQKKSLILTFPSEDIVDKTLQKHFIRGYFDGDGCISFNIDKPNKSLTILGTFKFLDGIKKILTKNKINVKIRKRIECNIYELSSYRYDDILKIGEFLGYQDCNISLERKKDKFEIFYQIYLRRRSLYE